MSIAWTNTGDDDGWSRYESDWYGFYRAAVSRHWIHIEFGGFPADWHLTIEVCELALPHHSGSSWDDLFHGGMNIADELLMNFDAFGHRGAELVMVSGAWPPPWTCPTHRAASNAEFYECAACQARYEWMLAHDWKECPDAPVVS